MNWQSASFDWNQARAFLATAEEGSLSAAARALGQTQPTLGRQVSALEEKLGVTLFERAGRSLSLTQSGLELLYHFRAMGDAASRISLTASGQSQAIEGQVCITASDGMATYLLPPVVKKLRAAAPGIEIEIVADNEVSDLNRREADIAIRHVRPEQPDLIAKLVRETTGHLYAATSYLDTHGRPETAADVADATFVVLNQSERMLSALNGLGLSLTKRNFKLVSANSVVGWEMVKQGLGIGVMIPEIADLTPEVERVLPDLPPYPVPIWLVTHRELRTSRRIRLVFDLLAEALA
ncbi:MAG: LysR family transcriptional regulator [Hyphomicrobiales bacterium]|nr:LysR family transcriptional regulator [Hyphomicrobiales bacterium]